MKFEIKSTRSAVDDQGLKILVHGPAGAGKTRMCATTGDLEHTLIISAEGGLLSLREYDIDAVQVDTLDQLRQVYAYLARGEHRYRWICLDSVSEIAEVVLEKEKSKSNDGRRAYGEMADTMFTVLRNFRNLPYHVVMTAKQGREEDRGSVLYVPLLPGRQLTQNIAYVFDEVFALRVMTEADGTVARYLQTARDGQYEAKDRSGGLAMYEPVDLAHVHRKISGADPREHLEPSEVTVRSTRDEPDAEPADGGAAAQTELETPGATGGVHWSERVIEEPEDHSGREAWKSQDRRFESLLKGGKAEAFSGDLKGFIIDRHGVEAWEHIPAELLEKWNDVLVRQSARLQQGQDETARARWILDKLQKHENAA